MKFLIPYPLNLPFLVSQRWGENAAYYKTIGMKGHNGWDFSLPVGTPIYACHDGKVDFAGIDGTDSKTIGIDTLCEYVFEGKPVTFRTMYAHLSEYFVAPGQLVKKGEKIGLSGNTGRYTTGPHLHFGVKPIVNYSPLDVNNGYNGAVDPVHFFDGTYPNTEVLKNSVSHVEEFVAALNKFQRAEGITPARIIGPKTTLSLKKYKLI